MKIKRENDGNDSAPIVTKKLKKSAAENGAMEKKYSKPSKPKPIQKNGTKKPFTKKADTVQPFDNVKKFDGSPKNDKMKKFDKPKKSDGPKKFDGANKFDGTKKFDGPKKFDGLKKFDATKKFDGAKKNSNKPVNGSNFSKDQEKPTDWNEFKKKKKEVRAKRKQSNKFYDVITKAKQIGEKLRVKTLEGGKEEKNRLVNELHSLMGSQQNYVKFVLAHDMARIVQYMLKFGAPKIRQDIADEIIPYTVQMLQSKYGKFCVKRMLKYGNPQIRANCIKAMYGHAVKLASHALSASVFEYAYSTWASPLDKVNFIQEFYGDMYKQSKDINIKHLRDVYKDSPDMKTAAIGATKGNLSRILNKDLLDSGLVQSVLAQFLSECNAEDKTEMITQLAPHAVVINNSKDGARVVMQCIWHGTNKDRKVAMKALKEHVVEICKHEHGHTAILALLDAADDTVLVHKLILGEILKNALKLVGDDWGRKVLLWLMVPAERTHFHPQFIKELEDGKENSTCKKEAVLRRKELLGYSSKSLLESIGNEPKLWLEFPSRAVVTLAILKKGDGKDLEFALNKISEVIVDCNWKIMEGEAEIMAIEEPGIHMTLKKLAQNDKKLVENNGYTFGEAVVGLLNDDVIKSWVKLNRGCFLLITLFENGKSDVQKQFKEILTKHISLIKKQDSSGSKILMKKITE